LKEVCEGDKLDTISTKKGACYKMKQLKIENEVHKRLKVAASIEGVTMSEMIDKALAIFNAVNDAKKEK
jgi:predicted HicB family RNase H-like nuclease